MTEYINSFLLLTLLGIIYHTYYKYKIFFRAKNIMMDSLILYQLNNLEKVVNSKVIKTRKGRKKKADTNALLKINEEDGNDIRDK